jgi:hypothetical protein
MNRYVVAKSRANAKNSGYMHLRMYFPEVNPRVGESDA